MGQNSLIYSGPVRYSMSICLRNNTNEMATGVYAIGVWYLTIYGNQGILIREISHISRIVIGFSRKVILPSKNNNCYIWTKRAI